GTRVREHRARGTSDGRCGRTLHAVAVPAPTGGCRMGTALITGASSGLGSEYAKVFAQHKHDVVLVARRGDRLEALATELRSAHGVRAEAVAVDLSSPQGPARVVDEVARLGLQIEF